MNYRKITAFALAIITIMSMSACNKSNSEQVTETGIISEAVQNTTDGEYYLSKETYKTAEDDYYSVYEYDTANLTETCTSYYTSDNSIRGKVFDKYDIDGKELEYTEYDKDNESRHFVYTYDNNGNVTLTNIYYKGELSRAIQCFYDDNNNTVKTIMDDPSGISVYEYVYDENGHLSKQTMGGTLSHNIDEVKVSWYALTVYDKNENMLSYHSYNIYDDGDIQEYGYDYEYNENNQQVRSYVDYGAGNKTLYSEFEYDDNGNVLKDTYYTKDGKADEINVYTYDDNNNLLSKLFYKDDVLEHEKIYTYDEDGNMLSETFHDYRDGTGLKHEYTYDEHGNKLSETTYDGDGNVNCARTYEYTKLNFYGIATKN